MRCLKGAPGHPWWRGIADPHLLLEVGGEGAGRQAHPRAANRAGLPACTLPAAEAECGVPRPCPPPLPNLRDLKEGEQ